MLASGTPVAYSGRHGSTGRYSKLPSPEKGGSGSSGDPHDLR